MVTFPNPALPVRFPTALDPARPTADAVTPLLLALDTLDHGFALMDREARIHHATPVLRTLFDDNASDGLPDELRRFATALWGTVNVRGLDGGILCLDTRTLQVGGSAWRLQGTYVGADLFGNGPSVLVGVRPGSDPPLCADRVAERFGLTRKQSRVALLLVQGLRNDEIARRLYISPHTARHHVEQVRLKVGGHTRGAVVSRILQPQL
jgi:DNA-binding CsgD family transcriptional regulator